MLDLMAVKQDDGTVPLYINVAHTILREMRKIQQQTGERFNYTVFKKELFAAELTPAQLSPLQQRLAMLESFMPPVQSKKGKEKKPPRGTDWTHEVMLAMTLRYLYTATYILIARPVDDYGPVMSLCYARSSLLTL